ncbi:MAG: hypothetical protein JZU63_13745 [Rhodoferax sp.]|nr:hypothetical protein [Rhodoferax sp.]
MLDPIDGTKSFITGKPLFGTLIACLKNGEPIIGIIDQCVLDERWVGVVGRGTTLNGEPVSAYAIVASGFGADVVVEADLGLYDYCALVPVVEGAGGVITDWDGRRLTLQNHDASRGRVVACANAGLHVEAVALLGKTWSRSGHVIFSTIKHGIWFVAFGIGIGMAISKAKK